MEASGVWGLPRSGDPSRGFRCPIFGGSKPGGLLLRKPVASQQLDGSHLAVMFRRARMTPGRWYVPAHGINFGQGGMSRGEIIGQADGLQQQGQRLVLPSLSSVELRQVVVRNVVLWLARNPFPLFL